MFPTAAQALDYYAFLRSARLQGVSQPSQRRYANYIETLLTNRVREEHMGNAVVVVYFSLIIAICDEVFSRLLALTLSTAQTQNLTQDRRSLS